MKTVVIMFALLLFLPVGTVIATTGNTPLEAYVNPCSIFLTRFSCEMAGCYWWSDSCHESSSPIEGTIGPEYRNLTINITILTDPVTTPGNLSFIVNLTNERNYGIDGILNYWVENHLTKIRYYEHNNKTLMIPASSTIEIDENIFLLLPIGDYFLKAEFIRTPIEVREKISDQKDFTVVSALGWGQPSRPLDPAEIAIIITFLILIIIFAYGIYRITADFYSYTFSE